MRIPNDRAIKNVESDVWGSGAYEAVSRAEGEEWARKFWKRWNESIASAKKHGWRFVPVLLSELCPNTKSSRGAAQP